MNNSKILSVLLISIILIISCSSDPKVPIEVPKTIKEDSVQGKARAKEITENVALKVEDGLQLTLWATDSLAPDPIAMSIDDLGRVYLTRTNRQKNSEFDIRGHRDWMTPSIKLQTVEDRRAFLRETFTPEKSEENKWLKDLNNDGSHDWKDLTVEKEEVWRLSDENKDGLADISVRILNDFNEEVTDVAGALLVRENDVFVGLGPDMWRLTDTNGDEVLDTKTSLAHGFAVHIGFGGHGMSGAIEGPDGKIYWGIGDIGANITTKEGEHHKYPNQGVIVRANPDGSDFEVFARGLRNTHEFVFDAYGNIITSDNDGDHRGESERLMHVVEGSDAGWRANWQYGKYTDPKNNGYNVWMDEKLYVPYWEGQAAYIIPPIQNFHNGPTGMVYNPGTALGKEWLDTFFLVAFVGTPSNSHIWGFTLAPKGASFELKNEVDVVSGILPTGIRFGPDGALYAADWVNGWNTKNYGRVWRMDVTANKNNLKKERKITEELMQKEYAKLPIDELQNLLSYADMRIRQKAQFELVRRGEKGYHVFEEVLQTNSNQFSKIHAIWGLGQLAAKEVDRAKILVDLLQDKDPEIIAQAAKVLGDVKYKKAGENLIPLLKETYPRTRFYAAQALGRIADKNAVKPLLQMLRANGGTDLYLRHAGVLALSRIGELRPIIDLVNDDDRNMRISAVLVLRRLNSAEVALFLKDEDEFIVTEAARAINDDWSIVEALPELAALLNEKRFISEPLLRRSINAALRVGEDKQLNDLIAFAKRKDAPAAMRGEALAAVATWAKPSELDRVDGRYRGVVTRDVEVVKTKIASEIDGFLKERDPEIAIATAKTLQLLDIKDYNEQLYSLMSTAESPKLRVAILTALGELGYEKIEVAMANGMKDKDQSVRTVALGLLSKIEVSKEELPKIVDPIFKSGSIREQQKMLSVLGEMAIEKSETVISQLITKAKAKNISEAVLLDLLEAVDNSGSEKLIAQASDLQKEGNTVEAFSTTLSGGNWGDGREYFNNNSAGQCVRCHALNGAGGQVGPALDNIGNILNREQILESLIQPSLRLAPGFGTISVSLKDGQTITGVLAEETEEELILITSAAEPMEIAKSRIQERENFPSGMPPMGSVMSKREIRDVIAYLASLRKG